jgi:hypothetical protein
MARAARLEPDRRTIRPPAWFIALPGAATLIALGAAAALYRYPGGTIYFYIALGVAALGLAGCLEVATSRLELTPDALEVRWLWSRRRYTRSDIQAVKWEWGMPVALQLTAGGWAKLPSVGLGSQGLANTLRAWLRRQPSNAP